MFFMSNKNRKKERELSIKENDLAVQEIFNEARVNAKSQKNAITELTEVAEKYGISGVLFFAMGGKERDD